MKNPFESGQIKNYVLLYASVVVIMVLFFFASSLFREEVEMQKKDFSAEAKVFKEKEEVSKEENKNLISEIKLLDKAY